MAPGEVVQNAARSAIGAINFGMPLLYTMETWWLAWRLPTWLILVFALFGLAAIAVAGDLIGISEREQDRPTPLRRFVTQFVELLLTSLVVSYAVLFLFGIVDRGDSFQEVTRLGLMQVVPLGLGASIANALFRERAGGASQSPPSFRKEMATFALGAALFAFNVAPTEEMELMAAHAGWWRLLLVAVVSLVVTYLVLYELEFRGRAGRVMGMTPTLRWGETFSGYAIALAVSAALLFGYGHFLGVPLEEGVQQTIALSMVAAFGGAAARVVI